jgi:hypothetical protein
MRFALVIYIFMTAGQPGLPGQSGLPGLPVVPMQPIEIPQSTELGCEQQAEKVKADMRKQAPEAFVVTLCIDKGSAY